jgi:hypothetical protein
VGSWIDWQAAARAPVCRPEAVTQRDAAYRHGGRTIAHGNSSNWSSDREDERYRSRLAHTVFRVPMSHFASSTPRILLLYNAFCLLSGLSMVGGFRNQSGGRLIRHQFSLQLASPKWCLLAPLCRPIADQPLRLRFVTVTNCANSNAFIRSKRHPDTRCTVGWSAHCGQHASSGPLCRD